jgi:uncharacterized membrane protein YtjA (UPF0391 family)
MLHAARLGSDRPLRSGILRDGTLIAPLENEEGQRDEGSPHGRVSSYPTWTRDRFRVTLAQWAAQFRRTLVIQISLAALVITVIAGIFAMGVTDAVSTGMSRLLFFVFLGVFLVSLLLHLSGSIDKTELKFPFKSERKDLPPRERRRRM